MGDNNVSRSQTARLGAYFALAYAISWAIEIPLALQHQGVIPPILPTWAHYLAAYGPALAALIAARIYEGRPGLSDLVSRMGMWRVRPIWWLAALSPLVLGFGAAVILNAAAGSQIRLSARGVASGPADISRVEKMAFIVPSKTILKRSSGVSRKS